MEKTNLTTDKKFFNEYKKHGIKGSDILPLLIYSWMEYPNISSLLYYKHFRILSRISYHSGFHSRIILFINIIYIKWIGLLQLVLRRERPSFIKWYTWTRTLFRKGRRNEGGYRWRVNKGRLDQDVYHSSIRRHRNSSKDFPFTGCLIYRRIDSEWMILVYVIFWSGRIYSTIWGTTNGILYEVH